MQHTHEGGNGEQKLSVDVVMPDVGHEQENDLHNNCVGRTPRLFAVLHSQNARLFKLPHGAFLCVVCM